MNDELRRRIDAFLARHTTLALATAQSARDPWVAPLFYAHDEHLCCYFLSGARSRHIRDLMDSRFAAVTVYADQQQWQGIQGLQMRVAASPVSNGERDQAMTLYAQKFPFVGGWLLRKAAAPVELTGALAGSVVWQLRPIWVRLIDNTQGFGHRDEADLRNVRQ